MDTRTIMTAYRPTRAGLPAHAGDDLAGPPGGSSLAAVCWRRRWTVMAVMLMAVIGGAAYLVWAPKVYTSQARLFVPPNGPRLLSVTANPDAAGADAFLNRQSEILKGEPILTRALEISKANDLKTFDGQANKLAGLRGSLSVGVGKKDEIISIGFDSRFADEAAIVVNAIVSAYQEYAASLTQSSAAGLLKVLREEKTKQERALDDKLKEIVAFKKTHGEMFFTNDRGQNILTQNMATISDQLTRARLEATKKHADYLSSNSKRVSYRVWQDAEGAVEEYEKLYEAEKVKALEINGASAEFGKLQQDADRTTKMCDALDARIKEVNVTENTGAMNIQVLETAKVEEKPTKPNKKMILLAAAAAGLALGCGAGFLHEVLDQRVHTADETGRLLGLPVLGVVPLMRGAIAGARQQIGRAAYLAPNGEIAEAFRMLRAAVYFGWPNKDAKSVLITSPERGDGKSTTASNLAIAMAQAGQKVLLIDADLRAPVQHKLFDVPNTSGLTDVIVRGLRGEQAIRPTDVPGLSILTSGTPTQNPSDITNGQSFGRFLQQMEQDYDLIVIDSPPLLAVADARILGAQAGLTLLTVRAEKTTRQDVKQVCQQLLSVGSSILGVVLNGTVSNRRNYGSYGDDLADMDVRGVDVRGVDLRGVRPANVIDSTLLPGRSLPAGQDANGRALTY